MDVLICLNCDVCKSKNTFLKRFHAEKTEMFEAFLNSADFMQPFHKLNNDKDITTENADNPVSSKVNLLTTPARCWNGLNGFTKYQPLSMTAN